MSSPKTSSSQARIAFVALCLCFCSDTTRAAEEEEAIRLIDLGGGSACIYPPLLSYSPGDGVHDPLYSPPELNLLPDDAKPPTLRNARGLWKEHQPYLFDLFSVGALARQLRRGSLVPLTMRCPLCAAAQALCSCSWPFRACALTRR
jgi:hypothetical protein